MQNLAQKDFIAIRQLPKLKSLLKKYRQVKVKQAGLLKLSELASTVTDMTTFYNELQSVIQTLLTSDSFHIVLADQSQNLTLAHCHNDTESDVLDRLSDNQWNNSLTALVYQENAVLHCNETQRQALIHSGKIHTYNSKFVDWLGVPLVRGQQVIGVIALKSFAKNVFFNDKDSLLLQFIAEHLVTAIDRVRSRELLELNIKQRTEKLTETNLTLQREIGERQKAVKIHKALLTISEITSSSADMHDFYQALHKEVSSVISAKNLTISLLSDDKNELELPYSNDEKSYYCVTRPFKNSLDEIAVNKEQPILVKGGQVLTVQDNGELLAEPLLSSINVKNLPLAWLAAPLMVQGEIFGVLSVQHYQNENAYQQSDLELIHFVSQHIAIAIWRNKTHARIEQHNEQLEKSISLRTQELQLTNFNLRMQIEERRKAEAKLYHDAHHDGLTKLPNRAMFSERLEYALRHLKRHPDNRCAVLFIDLDRFKVINDTLGHHTGDLFLIEIAKRLKSCVRDNDVLARLGGDEFVILLDSLQSQDDVEEIATRIISSISEKFELEGNTLYSNASIGITLCNNQYKDADAVLCDADAAMYQAKHMGRGRYVFFDESMREKLMANMTFEHELRVALDADQFELHYQEIANLQTRDVIGFEVLLRWNHPTKGLLKPEDFMFTAEETGVVVGIEAWVVKNVCAQLKHWANTEYSNALIAINLSGRYLTQANELNKLIQLIQAQTNEQHRLIFEFSESAVNNDANIALKSLRKLNRFGVKLALDEYGASHSLFNFLHNYPFEFIKLDQSFIRKLNNNERNISLIKALLDLGTQFGYRVIVKGVNSEDLLAKLQAIGCEFGQGDYLHKCEKLIDVEDDFLENVSA